MLSTLRFTGSRCLLLCVLALLISLLYARRGLAQEGVSMWEDEVARALVREYVDLRTGAKSPQSSCATASILLEAVERRPMSEYAADALLEAACCLRSAGQYSRAVAVLERVITEYPASVVYFHPCTGWFEAVHEVSLVRELTLKPLPPDATPGARAQALRHEALRNDADRALSLYRTYVETFPETAADWARLEAVRIYRYNLKQSDRALELLRQINVPDLREAAILKHQDRAFADRLVSALPSTLMSVVGFRALRAHHWVAINGSLLRVRLGLEQERKLTPEQEAEAKAEALKRLDAFWQEHKPEFEGLALMEEEAEPEEKEQ